VAKLPFQEGAMIRAVIFDVDGTLVDSVDLHARAWQQALARFGRQESYDKVRAQIGKGGDQLMPVFLSEEELERFGEALSAFRSELFTERFLPQVRPLPGVRPLFERLRQGGRRIALASSAPRAEIEHYVELLGIEGLIDGFTTADEVDRSKPHPDVFARALALLGIEDPAEVIAVGDSPFDAEAASRLGVPCIGLRSGGFSGEDLRAAGCIALYEDPSELAARLDESPLAPEERSADPAPSGPLA
jgi:HAD superfamily hydrolase (TIGR01509 family)